MGWVRNPQGQLVFDLGAGDPGLQGSSPNLQPAAGAQQVQPAAGAPSFQPAAGGFQGSQVNPQAAAQAAAAQAAARAAAQQAQQAQAVAQQILGAQGIGPSAHINPSANVAAAGQAMPVNFFNQVTQAIKEGTQQNPYKPPTPQAGPSPQASSTPQDSRVHPTWSGGGYLAHGQSVPGRPGNYDEQIAGQVQARQASGNPVPQWLSTARQSGAAAAAQVTSSAEKHLQSLSPGSSPAAVAQQSSINTAAVEQNDPWKAMSLAGLNPNLAGPGAIEPGQDKPKSSPFLQYLSGANPDQYVHVVERKMLLDPGAQPQDQQVGGTSDPAAVEAKRQQYIHTYADTLAQSLQGGSSVQDAQTAAANQANRDADKTTLQQIHNQVQGFQAQDRQLQAQALVQQIQGNLKNTQVPDAVAKQIAQKVQAASGQFGQDPDSQNAAVQALFKLADQTRPNLSHPNVSGLDPQLQAQGHAWQELQAGNNNVNLAKLGIHPEFAALGAASGLVGSAVPDISKAALAGRVGAGIAAGSVGGGTLNALSALVHGQNVPQAFVQGATNPANLAAGGALGPFAPAAASQVVDNAKPAIRPQDWGNLMADAPQLGPGALRMFNANVRNIDLKALNKQVEEANQFSKGVTVPGSGVAGQSFRENLQDRLKAAPPETNPMVQSGRVNYLPEIEPGNHAAVPRLSEAAQSGVLGYANLAAQLVGKLSNSDKASFWDYVEGTKDYTKSNNPANVKGAMDMWRKADDMEHATSYALDEQIPYVGNHAIHNWDDTPGYAQDAMRAARDSYDVSPGEDIQNQPRIVATRAEGRSKGLVEKNFGAPEKDIEEWANSKANKINVLAHAKGLSEADAGLGPQNRTIDMGPGKNIKTTEQGYQALARAQVPEAESGLVGKAYDKLTYNPRRYLLSFSQFHPININMLKAAPTALLTGHPVEAAKILANSPLSIYRPYSRWLQERALERNVPQEMSLAGFNPRKYSSFETSGVLPTAEASHDVIFGQQVPQAAEALGEAAVKDIKRGGTPLNVAIRTALGKKPDGTSLTSPEAAKAMGRVRNIMGFYQARTPGNQKLYSRTFLGGQFTPSKFGVLKGATERGVGGQYSRAAVAGNYLADLGLMYGGGKLSGQNTDNLKDLAIRALVNPAIPLPNDQKLGLPQNDISEFARLALNLNRDKNGRMALEFNPRNIPNNLVNFGQSRLNILPNAAIQATFNRNGLGNPIYSTSSHVPLGTKIAQGATNILSGWLPIGAQGIMRLPGVKGALPQSLQDALNMAQPPSKTSNVNPLIKSLLSAGGLRLGTDETTGKGLEMARGREQRASAEAGMSFGVGDTGLDGNKIKDQAEADRNTRELRAQFDLYTNKSSLNSGDWAKFVENGVLEMALHGSPQQQALIDKLRQWYTAYPSHDPLWDLPNDKLNAVARIGTYFPSAYQAPALKADVQNVTNSAWFQQLQQDRSKYFASLPPGDQNLQNLPPDRPAAADQYDPGWTSAQKAQYFQQHPEVTQYYKLNDQYQANQASAMGLPQALSGSQQSALNQFDGLQQGGVGSGTSLTGKAASAFLKAHPDLAAYFNYEKASTGQENQLTGNQSSGGGSSAGSSGRKASHRSARHSFAARNARFKARNAQFKALNIAKKTESGFKSQNRKILQQVKYPKAPPHILGLPKIIPGQVQGLPFMNPKTVRPVDTTQQNVKGFTQALPQMLKQINPAQTIRPDIQNVTKLHRPLLPINRKQKTR